MKDRDLVRELASTGGVTESDCVAVLLALRERGYDVVRKSGGSAVPTNPDGHRPLPGRGAVALSPRPVGKVTVAGRPTSKVTVGTPSRSKVVPVS